MTPNTESTPFASAAPRAHPRKLPTPTKRALTARGASVTAAFVHRFAKIGVQQARNAKDGLLPPALLAKPLRLAFEDLGGTFIKFGQILASSPGLFGPEISDEFRSCLDTGPEVPLDQVISIIEDELGCSISEIFTNFDPDPIGRASIAVVHRATLLDGRDVAVKVLRPGIEHLVATYLDLK